ncbi:MAG: DUF72 domain-containing protein [Candidatus Eremiobacteraeota bacterium]|nr:DUF72 domain-containing protein [Candidatus Eremiobacteraeota bacterium]
MSNFRLGTSGFTYGDWRNRFYPKGVSQSRWLAFYAQRFSTVELNATTYRLPKEAQVARWCDTVADNFIFTVKLSRLITHRKDLPPRLDDFIHNYMDRIGCFDRSKLGQILCQFPPFLERDDQRLEAFLDKLPAEYRYVVEFRHKSWNQEAVYQILRRRKMAFCIHDYPRAKTADVVTADFAYVRFHGYTSLYAGSYPKRTLQRWAKRLRAVGSRVNCTFIYFNNDVEAAAIGDAQYLRKLLNGQ